VSEIAAGRIVTPMQMAILMRYYVERWPATDAADTERSATDTAHLFRLGLLRSRSDGAYETTERAAVYLEAILALPLPEQRWVMPETPP
jgi:hypothetical protein